MSSGLLGWIVFAGCLLAAAALVFVALQHFDAETDKALTSGLLGWPFLLFLILAAGAFFAGDRFMKMFESRKWSISKDGVSVEDVIDQVEGKGLELSERVEKLEARLVAIEGGGASPDEGAGGPDGGDDDGDDDD
jgi:hypothetical protein